MQTTNMCEHGIHNFIPAVIGTGFFCSNCDAEQIHIHSFNYVGFSDQQICECGLDARDEFPKHYETLADGSRLCASYIPQGSAGLLCPVCGWMPPDSIQDCVCGNSIADFDGTVCVECELVSRTF